MAELPMTAISVRTIRLPMKLNQLTMAWADSGM